MRTIAKIFFISLMFLSGCKETPKLEGFRSQLWIEDKNGCNGKRTYLAEILLSKTTELKGTDDDDLVKILGKPDKYEGGDRGKRVYYYYTQQGSQCGSGLLLEGTKIMIEFDALGKVRMITERKY
ncbi:MAG: hypothetical protein K2X86_11870 [Cytophagaceae bacterium]|nr:hypothetical protein [Cytophagaceae bacterium]